ncbi:RNA 2',3'-cyclic phosphodiesterase [Ectobacillus sp. JY-23]|uniref:RNA 2',3'-cyclic phosphodiesterase n=1 Tax=Ectobacillus sp. JY-23 TaxID=2933872 RepID=UPI001FF30C30|nr:RNA 2',3'-cyclic phosphodiesterase [Ectobacillus sp. JY-23]UOY94342.1 RNA 2',3'-cyclic phosphodiesterase [Ectobacillus sp. JY-23]
MTNHYFIAIPLPDFVKEELAMWKNKVASTLGFRTWVHQNDYHITLAFLGSAAQALPSLQRQLSNIRVQKFELSLKGLKTFGVPERPRILWADVTYPPELMSLQVEIHKTCEMTGIELEKRPYRPHITLARRFSAENAFFPPSYVWKPLSFEVTRVVLYETHMMRIPKYEELFVYHL